MIEVWCLVCVELYDLSFGKNFDHDLIVRSGRLVYLVWRESQPERPAVPPVHPKEHTDSEPSFIGNLAFVGVSLTYHPKNRWHRVPFASYSDQPT